MRRIKYNPAFLDSTERARRFGARHHDLDELVRILRGNLLRSRNQHVLVVGPRGMGKTTLLLRAVDEVVADPELSAAWLPIVAPEETYRVATIGEFWLEMVFNLHRATGDPAHELAYEELRSAHDRTASESGDRRLATAALGYLLDVADRVKKRLVLVVENLQLLFGEQLMDRDAWALREVLIGEPRIMLLASSVSSFREIEDPKAPLFEQFLVHQLEPLDTDGCVDLWQRLTDEAVPRRRMRALEILTGGNPRLLVILAEFAGKLSLRELTSDLANLIDEHTDYLKMTTEALPALERKVFVTLAEIWDYAAAAEVASQARVDLNVASAQLNRLASRGAVVSRRRGRGKQYRVAERLYCIYHLMRRRGGVAARARAATEFMVAYYDMPALTEQFQAIVEEVQELAPNERLELLWVVGELLSSPALAKQRSVFLARIPLELAKSMDSPEVLKRWFEPPDDLFEVLRAALGAANQGRSDEAVAGFERVVVIGAATGIGLQSPAAVATATALAMLVFLSPERNQWADAQLAISRALNLVRSEDSTGSEAGPTVEFYLLLLRAGLHHWRGGEADAIQALFEASEIPTSSVFLLSRLAEMLVRLGRIPEALAQLRKLTSKDDDREARIDAVLLIAIALAIMGAVREVLQCLEAAVLAPHLEPLILALRILEGQEASGPQEIEQIAADIAQQIREARAKSEGASANPPLVSALRSPAP